MNCFEHGYVYSYIDNRSLDRQIPQAHLSPRPSSISLNSTNHDHSPSQSYKMNDYNSKSSSTPTLESPSIGQLDSSTHKDLLALHNEAWSQYQPAAINSPQNAQQTQPQSQQQQHQQQQQQQPQQQQQSPQQQVCIAHIKNKML